MIAGIVIGMAISRAAPTPSGSTATDPPTSRTPGRNMYSPDIRIDEYVRQKQLKVVEALERQCRAVQENCKLAEASRQALMRRD